MQKRKLLHALMGPALVASLGWSGTASGQDTLTIATGNTGGTFYPVGVGLASILSDAGISASAELGGGNSNIISISNGQVDIGFTFAPTVVFARNAEEPFEESVTNLRGLVTLYPNYTQIAVTDESGLEDVEELEGQPFASQPLSAGSTTFFRMVLDANGLSEDDLDIVVRGGPAQGASAVRDRRAVGFQATAGIPNGSFSEAFVSVPMHLLSIDEDAYQTLHERNPGLVRARVPAGTYQGQDEPVETMAASTILIVNEDMPEDQAYAVTSALIENIEKIRQVHGAVSDLTVETMSEVAGIEMHPGAAEAFEEAGQ